MKQQLPVVHLARHGETAWSISRQHTGLTDLPLTEFGERNADRLGQRLTGYGLKHVFTSPLLRAKRTCELAGFADVCQLDQDLVEWNYGDYEGTTTAQIQQQRPGWDLYRDGCPNGESVADVAIRVKRVIARIRAIDDDVLLFAHAHCLNVFAACWLGLEPSAGRCFYLGTAALSTLGYHHDRTDPVIRLWNDCSSSAS